MLTIKGAPKRPPCQKEIDSGLGYLYWNVLAKQWILGKSKDACYAYDTAFKSYWRKLPGRNQNTNGWERCPEPAFTFLLIQQELFE